MSDGIREFKYKGATVRPYEPFNVHQSEGFSDGSLRGGVCPTLRANKHDLVVIIENEET